MARAAFRAPFAGRRTLLNLRKRRHDPAVAASTAELEKLDCELFLREYEQAYAALREDPEEWADVEAERRAFDGSLMDGLADED